MENNKPLGIKDVAKKANVALATVDRVIHGRSGVSKKTRDKVLKVIEELNYQPNLMASNLSKNKSYTLGVLLPKSSDSTYWELPLNGIMKAKKELEQYAIKIELFLYDHNNSNEVRMQILKVINSDVDGLVLTPKFAQEMEILLQDCNEKNKPYVFIDSTIQEKNSLCSIQQPLYESGQLAAQLFSYCFHDGKVLVVHFKDAMDTDEIIKVKERGMVEFFEEINSSISTEKIVVTNFDCDKIDHSLKEILEETPDVKGVFIPNSKISTMGCYLDEKKGKKIILIGYDLLEENYDLIDKGVIDFLICQKPEEQGYQAIHKLFEHLVLRKEVEREIIMPLDIITRKNYKYY